MASGELAHDAQQELLRHPFVVPLPPRIPRAQPGCAPRLRLSRALRLDPGAPLTLGALADLGLVALALPGLLGLLPVANGQLQSQTTSGSLTATTRTEEQVAAGCSEHAMGNEEDDDQEEP